MIQKITLIILAVLLYSCDASSNKNKLNEKQLKEAQLKSAQIVDNSLAKLKDDSVKIANAPIKVTNFKIVKVEYSDYRNVQVTYKNVSDKTIEAIKFGIKGRTAFDKPAEFTGGFNGKVYGNIDEPIKPNKSNTVTFAVNSSDLKFIDYVRPYEIVYSDGEKFKLMVDH